MPQRETSTSFTGADDRGKGRRFKPGQSGNPGGRPKTKPWREALLAALGVTGKDTDKAAKLKAVAQACVEAAAGGDIQAMKEIGDRLDGKAAQAIIGGEEDDPPVRVTRIEIVAAALKGGT